MQKGQVKNEKTKFTICNILEYVWKFYNVLLGYLGKFSLNEFFFI